MARDQSKKERELYESEQTNYENSRMDKKNIKKIPQFKNEDEEAKFWLENDFTEYYDTAKHSKTH